MKILYNKFILRYMKKNKTITLVKCFSTALRVSEECVLPMSILQKGNASVIPVPACSFGTPNNTDFCHEL